MYNQIKAYFQQPAKGWDPVSESYALSYMQKQSAHMDYALIERWERWAGGFQNKKLVDLGAGPGLYTLEFIRRGAQVTWWDVSQSYLQLAKDLLNKHRLSAEFHLDYMDHLTGSYQLLFNRVCWYYCFDDKRFLQVIYNALTPGGCACLQLHNEYRVFHNTHGIVRGALLKASFYLNEWFGIKIGHVMPSRKRIRKLFSSYQFSELVIEEYGTNGDSTLIWLKK